MPARFSAHLHVNPMVQQSRHLSWRPGPHRAHPEYCKLCYICILHHNVLFAALSDHIYDESHTDEYQKDYAYNLGKEKESKVTVHVDK